jgi:hypothetical protein
MTQYKYRLILEASYLSSDLDPIVRGVNEDITRKRGNSDL